MNTKSYVLLIIMFMACLACTDLSNKQNNTRFSGKDTAVTLNWIGHWQSRTGKEELIKDIAREFEFHNQQCRVNMKFPSEVAGSNTYRPYLVKLYAEMARSGKVDWDIILLDHYLYSEIANELDDKDWGKKYLVDFEQLDWFKERHKPFIYEEPFYRNQTGGSLVGPFTEGFYTGLWYNKAIADKIGISVKSLGMKFEDFKEYIKKGYEYNQKNSDKIILLGAGNDLDNPMWLLSGLVISQLNKIDTTDLSTNLAALKKGFELFEQLSVFNPIETYGIKYDQDVLLRNSCLFVTFSSWIYNKWASIDSVTIKNIEIAELPVVEKDGPAYQGTYQSVFAVFKNSPHKDLAIALLKYMSSTDVGEKWLSSTKNPTGLKTQLNATELMGDEIDVFNYSIDKKFGKNMFNNNIFQLLFGRKGNIKLSTADILNGKISAEEAYNSVLKQLKEKK